MTQHAAIRFEDHAPPVPADPARMDVACFIGLIAERPGVALPEAVAAEFKRVFGDDEAALARPGRLLNRPVELRSLAAFEALYDAELRIEAQAVVRGGELVDALPGSGVPDTLAVVIDGQIREIDLRPLPGTPDQAVERIRAAGIGLEVSLGVGTRPALTLALPVAHGSGTLAVLPYPSLGFPETRRASARLSPCPMGMAVRQFFAMGGREAVVVRMGDPLPYDSPAEARRAALVRVAVREPVEAGLSHVEALVALESSLLDPVSEPVHRHGPTHAYGLPGTTFLCLPDLPELIAPRPDFAAVPDAPPAQRAAFAECLPPSAPNGQAAVSPYLAPVADAPGWELWAAALERVVGMLRRHERDKFLVAALPRPAVGSTPVAPPASAFLQLAEGWIRARPSRTAPEGLLAPDAPLAGHLARVALERGTFLSAAAVPMAGIRDVEARAASGLPTARILRDRGTIRLSADLTTSDMPQWADGPVSRLMALLLRQAREIGEAIVFEPSGPLLWSRIAGALEGLLAAAQAAGALAGDGPPDSYSVRCDGTTMSQDDIDAGRLIADVAFRPTVPVQRIVVRLPLTRDTGAIAATGGPA
jgi:uncharacterized protein